MKQISVFDTTISDNNLGNEIIMDSVYFHLREIFLNDFFFKLPYMEITPHTIQYIKWSDLVFFGGTNSLTSKMEKYKQWGLSLKNTFSIKDVVLMGLGWWQYQTEKTSFYTRILLKSSLSHKFIHAVRDSYTEQKLKEIGFDNVLNTGCPTLWRLDSEFCKKIKKSKSNKVVFTLTDYNKNPFLDQRIIEILEKNYEQIFFWVQGSGDYDYINKELKINKNIEIISPNLASFDNVLNNEEVDYIGTRLHAGIRALQYKRRTMIIGIDNRATEMAKNFNIPVLLRDEVDKLDEFINSEYETKINLPIENIQKWKNQFINL